MTHIMLDLETWGTTPGSDIRSIGACVFDPRDAHSVGIVGGKQPTMFYIATDNPEGYTDLDEDEPMNWGYKYPLTRNPATAQWWNDQSDAAKAAFADPVDLMTALQRFTYWLASVTDRARIVENDENGAMPHIGKWAGLRLWSHGSAFDPPILAAAYAAVGLPVPWHYRAPRDTRTIFEAAGMDPHRCLDMFTTGTHHHALDDAICQARAVCAAYKALGLARGGA